MIDDHSIVRNGIRMMIDTTDDITISGEAESAEEGLRVIHKGIFDVVLLDIGLPGMNGFDLLKILHVSHPDLPILMFSMYPEETYGPHALTFGASGYLSKNSSIDTLTSAIRQGALILPRNAGSGKNERTPAQGGCAHARLQALR